MTNEELNGTPVLVHPGLTIDLDGRRGQIGVVTYTRDEEIFVGFQTGKSGSFQPGELLMLKNEKQLKAELTKLPSSLTLNEFKELNKVSLLLDRGRNTDLLQAVEIASANPAILGKGMISVAENLGRTYALKR